MTSETTNRSARRRMLVSLFAAASAAFGLGHTHRARSDVRLPLIRINVPGPDLAPFFPLRVVQAGGFDRAAGFELQTRSYRSGVAALRDLRLGNADFAGAGFPVLPSFNAGLEGETPSRELVAVARLTAGAPPYRLMVRSALAERLTTIADIKGTSIGVHGASQAGRGQPGTYLQRIAEQWLAEQGLVSGQVRLVSLALSFDSLRAALIDRRLDLLFCEEPFATFVRREGLAVEAVFPDGRGGNIDAPASEVTLREMVEPRSDRSGEALINRVQGARLPPSSRDSGVPDAALRFDSPDHLRGVVCATRATVDEQPQRVANLRLAMDLAMTWLALRSPDEWISAFGLAGSVHAALFQEVFEREMIRFPARVAFDADELARTQELFQQLDLPWSDALIAGPVLSSGGARIAPVMSAGCRGPDHQSSRGA
ncbi:MAG: ABC transporter substrate-binding protein [Thioalkalivibrionaceae bacterium]